MHRTPNGAPISQTVPDDPQTLSSTLGRSVDRRCRAGDTQNEVPRRMSCCRLEGSGTLLVTPAEWGGWARSVHAPLYGHEAKLTHPTVSGYPTCVSGVDRWRLGCRGAKVWHCSGMSAMSGRLVGPAQLVSTEVLGSADPGQTSADHAQGWSMAMSER
jgi:hypothetical protein